MYLFVILLLFLKSDHVKSRGGGAVDYFSEAFLQGKNCKDPRLTTKLESAGKCDVVAGEDLNKIWEKCKTKLVPKLAQSCNPRKIEKVSYGSVKEFCI